MGRGGEGERGEKGKSGDAISGVTGRYVAGIGWIASRNDRLGRGGRVGDPTSSGGRAGGRSRGSVVDLGGDDGFEREALGEGAEVAQGLGGGVGVAVERGAGEMRGEEDVGQAA